LVRTLASSLAVLLSAQAVAGQTASGCMPVQVMSGALDPLSATLGHAGPAASGAYARTDGTLCRRLPPETLQEQAPEPPSPGRAFLFSALLPGMGQRYLDQGRWIAYLGIEVWAWIQFIDERNDGSSLRTDYQDLAWSVARRVSSGPRIEGDFEYYEALTKFVDSGAYDADPGAPGLQPEIDAGTFNGSIWQLAREIFLAPDSTGSAPVDSPAYRRALEYYQERSITPAFTWSWSENELQQTVYEDLIQQSDENLRNSTTILGVILANHVVSAVDALISARLRIPDPDALSMHVVPLLDRRRDWAFVVRLTP
jgi:hypothetical protein